MCTKTLRKYIIIVVSFLLDKDLKCEKAPTTMLRDMAFGYDLGLMSLQSLLLATSKYCFKLGLGRMVGHCI
jgi:hypothetical protein